MLCLACGGQKHPPSFKRCKALASIKHRKKKRDDDIQCEESIFNKYSDDCNNLFCYQHFKNQPLFLYDKTNNPNLLKFHFDSNSTNYSDMFDDSLLLKVMLKKIKQQCRHFQIPLETNFLKMEKIQNPKNFACIIDLCSFMDYSSLDVSNKYIILYNNDTINENAVTSSPSDSESEDNEIEISVSHSFLFDDPSTIDDYIGIIYDSVYFFITEKLASVTDENITLTIDQNCFDHTSMYTFKFKNDLISLSPLVAVAKLKLITKGRQKMTRTSQQHAYYRIPFIYFFNLLDPLYSYVYSGTYKKSHFIEMTSFEVSPYLVFRHSFDISALKKTIKMTAKKSKALIEDFNMDPVCQYLVSNNLHQVQPNPLMMYSVSNEEIVSNSNYFNHLTNINVSRIKKNLMKSLFNRYNDYDYGTDDDSDASSSDDSFFSI